MHTENEARSIARAAAASSAGVQAVLSDLTSATQEARALQIDVEAAMDAAGEIRDALRPPEH